MYVSLRTNKLIWCLVLSVVVLSVSATRLFAESDQEFFANLSDKMTEYEQTKKHVAGLEKENADKDRLLASATSSSKKQKKRIQQLEREVATLKNKLLESQEQLSKQEQEIAALRQKINLQQASEDIPINVANVHAWHSKATCQIIDWRFKPGDKAVKLIILNRKSRNIVSVDAVYEEKPDDRYFLAKTLPSGLQVVMPDDSDGTWTVNADSRKNYVAKIKDLNNIATSELDGNSNKNEDGGKTFKSGEAFIILKQSSMTVRPPIY